MTLLLVIFTILLLVLWQRVSTLGARIDMLESRSRPFAAEPEPEPIREPAPAAVPPPVREPEPAPREEALADMPSPQAEPAPTPEPVAPAAAPVDRAWSFEEIFGRRLPIWAGGVTLAVAGFLIVRLSIAAGLLSPPVRVVLGLIFGGALIGSAEVALRYDAVVRDARVRQALAGAGVATLYAMILAAANLYHLVGAGTAFAGMTLITVLAGGLSIRFGAPSAVLGLVGGLAAPALIGSSQPNVPLLTLYLALAVGGLCALGRQQRWWWLGAGALAGGFGWGALLIVHGALDVAAALSVGLYTLALAIGLPLLLTGARAGMLRLAGALIRCAQLAALVAVGGFAPLHWGLFGLISAAILWLSRREALFAEAPALGLGVAILLAFAWPHPAVGDFAAVLIGIAVIYGVPAAWRVWRTDASRTDAPGVAAAALATGWLPALHFPDVHTAWTALAGAVLAGGVAALGWGNERRGADARFATLAITAAVLLGFAGMEACAPWAWPPILAGLAFALFHLGWRARDTRVAYAGWLFGVVTLGLLLADHSLPRLFGAQAAGDPAMLATWTAFATWAAPALLAALLARRAGASEEGYTWQPAAVLIGYGAAAQVVPASVLPLAPAALLAGLALARRPVLLPAMAAAVAPIAGWAVLPLWQWLVWSGAEASGRLVVLGDWPVLADTALRVALPAAALLLAALYSPMPKRLRDGGLAAAGAMLTVAAHIGYKHLFAIDGAERFVARAFAERTLWEALLAGSAIMAWRVRGRAASLALGAAALLHFAWFTGLIDNPLWVRQDIGLWLVPAYAVAGGLLWLTPRARPGSERPRDWALMALATLGAFTLLRQTMHMPMILSDGTAPGEQIARSVLAIALAGGFLWTGIARGLRDWRIASLVLMLVAVVKVFLFDAAGLDGLARIASFAALGFSLIGVGWLYSRYLPDEKRHETTGIS